MVESPDTILARLNCQDKITTLGLMSGTSMDGLDLCYCILSLTPATLHYSIHWSKTVPYPSSLKNAIVAAVRGPNDSVGELHHRLGRWVAATVREQLSPAERTELDLIGSHGQTIYHEHGIASLQIGEVSYLARTFEVPVIHDFRSNDIAAGGCGAPLVPWIDQRVFFTPTENRICVNIGGISNITVLWKDQRETTGCDTGPGMALLDEAWQRLGRSGVDEKGRTAGLGTPKMELVEQWIQEDEFIQKDPPKSTGRDRYGESWIESHWPELMSLSVPDCLSTLAAFTAETIIIGCRRFIKDAEYRLIISGGGAHHSAVIAGLKQRVGESGISFSSDFNIDIDGKEAFVFALLAAAFVKGIPANLPTVTGAGAQVILGKLCL
ncbi:MAG: anhydro-N-acetylmuramic acid kinase [Fidelibacterota bacterium]